MRDFLEESSTRQACEAQLVCLDLFDSADLFYSCQL